ncbi:MAG: YdeI/OmpD-associated family protein [Pirellulales bacterium]
MQPRFFKSRTDLWRWFRKNHPAATELQIGLYKKNAGKSGVTYAEALDQALCFGWIDGVRNSIDESSYTIRFTPRKPKSTWSLVNTRRFRELEKLGLVEPAGREAFRRRDPEKTGKYSYENQSRKLEPRYEKQFRRSRKAWRFFEAQPPSYRRLASFWVMSARKEETRQRRLAILIGESSAGRRLAMLSGKKSTSY